LSAKKRNKKPVPKKTKALSKTETSLSKANLETERKKVLSHGRKFVRPLVPTKRRFLTLTAMILAGTLLVVVLIFALLIYVFKSDSALVYRVSRVIPYPAARVDGEFVEYGEYLFRLNPLKHYLGSPDGPSMANQQRVDFKSEEGKQKLENLRQIALREAEQAVIIQKLADEKNVKVTDQELDERVNSDIEQQGGKDKFLETIKYFYDWNLGDYEKVIKQQMLLAKLKPEFSAEQRKKAESALQRVKNGEDFAKVATEVSEDPGSKDKGGDLGSTGRGAYVPEFETAAYSLEPGQVSDIIETQFGFHIIKLLEKKDDQVHVAHILVQYAPIQDEITKRLDAASKKVFIKVTPADANAQIEQSSEPAETTEPAQ